MHHEARKIPRPAVLTALALLFGAATSVANAQSFVYAGTSSPSDPYAYLNDLSMPHGVTVNMGALDQIGKDSLKMPDGHYPASRGPQGAQGAEGGDAPVSQSFLPGRSGGHGAAPPPRKAAPPKAVKTKPTPAKTAATRP
ncbi:hypothetical protein CKO38_17365, partial [Rhodospirillum rubrum]|nr:hypothetical protein [Rhodospirillum rubrum]